MTIENEDADPVGPVAVDPREVFTWLAAKHGMIRTGDGLDENVVEMMAELVGLCASVADVYGDEESGGNAGEHIRSVYWPN